MELQHSSDPVESAARYIAGQILEHLDRGNDVTWLASGGSGIQVGSRVADLLAGSDLSRLSVTLTDERFGPIGHSDENWQQLLEAGFDLPRANLYRPLIGANREKTTRAFASWLEDHILEADYSIGLFGIGPDGHTAGIKPGTAAAHEAENWAVSYDGEDFERITMTFPAIRELNEAVIQTNGSSKHDILDSLFNTNQPIEKQPAQILKTIRSLLISDYKGL